MNGDLFKHSFWILLLINVQIWKLFFEWSNILIHIGSRRTRTSKEQPATKIIRDYRNLFRILNPIQEILFLATNFGI